MSTKNNYPNDPIPAKKIRHALLKLEDLLGKAIMNELLDEMERMGIYLSGENEAYFLHQIREALVVIFGVEAAELLMERLKKELIQPKD